MARNKDGSPQWVISGLTPTAKPPTGRRVWSIDMETVWLPFFTATNTMGDTPTTIPDEALGCPIRLAYEKDGSVKFSKTGKPVSKVAKPIADGVTLMRQEYIARLMGYTNKVVRERQEDYATQIKRSAEAGQPLKDHDREELNKSIMLQMEEEARQALAEKVAKQLAEEEAEKVTTPDKELVAVS